MGVQPNDGWTHLNTFLRSLRAVPRIILALGRASPWASPWASPSTIRLVLCLRGLHLPRPWPLTPLTRPWSRSGNITGTGTSAVCVAGPPTRRLRVSPGGRRRAAPSNTQGTLKPAQGSRAGQRRSGPQGEGEARAVHSGGAGPGPATLRASFTHTAQLPTLRAAPRGNARRHGAAADGRTD